MQQNDKEYQFIHNDPKHKENLSGRVTAACLNCRRKKIKCSGESNCVQCAEKGLLCSGPPSRKRPKRDHPHARVPEPSDRQQQAEATSATRSKPIRPGAAPLLQTESTDSGYGSRYSAQSSYEARAPASSQRPKVDESMQSSASAHLRVIPGVSSDPTQSRQTSVSDDIAPFASAPPHTPSPSVSDPPLAQYNTFDNPASSINTLEDWSFVSQANASFPTYHTDVPSESSHSAMVASAPVSRDSFEWSERRSPEGWWSGDAGQVIQSPDELISAAEVLEQQAQTLRRIASGPEGLDRGRNLSAQPPLVSIAHPGTVANIQHQPVDLQGSGAYNASSFYRPDGSYRTRLTPDVASYPSFWDPASFQQSTRPSEREQPPRGNMHSSVDPRRSSEPNVTEARRMTIEQWYRDHQQHQP